MVRRTPRQEPDVARARLAVVQHRLRAAGRRGAVRPLRARPLLPDGGGDGGPERVRREAAGRLSAVPEMTTGPRCWRPFTCLRRDQAPPRSGPRAALDDLPRLRGPRRLLLPALDRVRGA